MVRKRVLLGIAAIGLVLLSAVVLVVNTPSSGSRYTDALVYSRFLSGTQEDRGVDIVVDNSGCVYIVGDTKSPDFPLVNAFDETHNGDTDCFVVKLDASGETILYSTFVGGSGSEQVKSIAVDSSGCVYVTGMTTSNDLPTSLGAHDSSLNGTWDCFLFKLGPNGDSLAYCTYYGGSDRDFGDAVSVDSAGNAHVVGTTWSTDIPLVDALDEDLNGTIDCFIFEIDTSGESLLFSSYWGGTGNDYGGSCVLDSHGDLFITGTTYSTDYYTISSFDDTHNGRGDCFILKLNGSNNSVIYSSLVGGILNDYGLDICVDTSGCAYVAGRTISPDLPVVNAFCDYFSGGDRDCFVLKLSADGQSLHYLTYVGGPNADDVDAIAIDEHGNAYVTGFTLSEFFPVEDAYSYRHNGGLWDCYIFKLNASGNGLDYSTYFGGRDGEEGCGIAVDSTGTVYVTGWTISYDFPLLGIASGSQFPISGYTCFVLKLSDLTDTDDEGLRDVIEVDVGTDVSLPDTDADEIPDLWEYTNGFDPLDPEVSLWEFMLYNPQWLVLTMAITVSVPSFLLYWQRSGRLRRNTEVSSLVENKL